LHFFGVSVSFRYVGIFKEYSPDVLNKKDNACSQRCPDKDGSGFAKAREKNLNKKVNKKDLTMILLLVF